MKAVLMRVRRASVTIDERETRSIGRGFLILLAVTHDDTEAQAVKLADKLCSLRLFEDADGKINLTLDEVGGEIMIVSQFTLYGNCRKGRRPDFLAAARPPRDRDPPLRKIRLPRPRQGLSCRDRRVRRLYGRRFRQRRSLHPHRGHEGSGSPQVTERRSVL